MWDELEEADPDVNRLRSLRSEAQGTVFVTGQLVCELSSDGGSA
jgi:hypothetical protein